MTDEHYLMLQASVISVSPVNRRTLPGLFDHANSRCDLQIGRLNEFQHSRGNCLFLFVQRAAAKSRDRIGKSASNPLLGYRRAAPTARWDHNRKLPDSSTSVFDDHRQKEHEFAQHSLRVPSEAKDIRCAEIETPLREIIFEALK